MSSLQKRSSKSEERFWRYRTLKMKKHQNFSTFEFSRPFFDPWGHKWPPIFVLVRYLWSVMINKEFDISQGVFSLLFWKIDFFFYPILQYCQFSWNRVPSENERSKKKTDAFFGFGMKNFIFSNVVFHFLRSNLDFTTKRKKIFFKKSRNFDDFFTSKRDISRSVGPISMIFFANCRQFYSLSNYKKESFRIFQIFEKNSKSWFLVQKTAKLAKLQIFDLT